MRIQLLGGAYLTPGLIAVAQRSVNLYPEVNPKEVSPAAPVTHYPRPGLRLLSSPPAPGRGRMLYQATNGQVFAVIDRKVYYINPDFQWTEIGTMVAAIGTPASAADNGTTIVIVDGTPQGYAITMADRSFAQIGDPVFVGGTRVDFIDGFLIFNQPGTINWYSTEPYSLAFNGLYFGRKSAWPDTISTLIAIGRSVWLAGPQKGEVWYNAGTVPFAFQADSSVIIEHGIAAPYSMAKMDVNVYWLSQNPEGARMVMKGGAKRTAERISTHAMEAELLKYARVDDAIGSTYQIRGHSFYTVHFPTADKSWTYDEATQQWHEPAWADKNGVLRRTRATFTCFGYGKNLGLDFANGDLYHIDESYFLDSGTDLNLPNMGGSPLVCVRSMPHLIDEEDFDRLTLWKVIADITAGDAPGTVPYQIVASPWSSGFSSGFGPLTSVAPPLISCRVSKTRGFSWGNPRMKPLGAAGKYNVTPTWNRWGSARDFVVELSWSSPSRTALDSVFIEAERHEADK